MSRKCKFYNKEGLYFVSFATVNWIDVFVRDHYSWTMIESLDFCRKNKGMEIYAWCIMPSHVHLIFRAKENNPSDLLRDFKTFTSKKIRKMIEDNPQESRRECLPARSRLAKAGILWIACPALDAGMERAGAKNSNVKGMQFWQQHNKPIELWSSKVIDQKVDYIHDNPVKAGFVNEPYHWKYSSAIDYSGGKGLLEIDYV